MKTNGTRKSLTYAIMHFKTFLNHFKNQLMPYVVSNYSKIKNFFEILYKYIFKKLKLPKLHLILDFSTNIHKINIYIFKILPVSNVWLAVLRGILCS